jgi:N-acetyl-1-D-myo-inositol-2-amino-2-deoxy-alpha-D-glucopyranoside deacetylase/mycothiol S-conjugate amidase
LVSFAGQEANVSQHRSLIFVGAHPDDESFGPGGTLAKYAAAGVRTYYACATRGEVGEATEEHMAGHATKGDMRWAELECAARALGLAGVIHLGYRDSGMPGSPDNHHPEALAAAPLAEVAGRVVKVLREVRPEVVITFDSIGGYRHPDHIAIHNATVEAFTAAGDPARYPEAGPPFQPQKLYYAVFPRGLMKLAVRLAPLFRADPRRFGRNADIDLVSLTEVDFPVHARVNVSGEPLRRKAAASACHRSQLDDGPNGRWMMSLWARLTQHSEGFMRAVPPVENGRLRESDLFAGVG